MVVPTIELAMVLNSFLLNRWILRLKAGMDAGLKGALVQYYRFKSNYKPEIIWSFYLFIKYY